MTDAGQMWDRRFSEHAWPSEPDPFLVELADDLPPGRGLDLGSGPGRNSLWLASKGWEMTLVDASRVALAQAEQRAAEAGGHLFVVGHDVANLGHHGPPDPERLLTVERLSQALPATVVVEVLDQRARKPDHTTAIDAEAPGVDAPGADPLDVAVLAWATRRAP